MSRNIPLHVLDEYAKTLTNKQCKLLYEKKCNKKYIKPLYENMCYQTPNSYNVYLTKYILENANTTVDNILLNYINKYHLQYNIVSEGIKLYTPSKLTYQKLIKSLLENGFNKELLMNVTSKNNKKIINLL